MQYLMFVLYVALGSVLAKINFNEDDWQRWAIVGIVAGIDLCSHFSALRNQK